MSFGIGVTAPRSGPGAVLEKFGTEKEEGKYLDWRVVTRLARYLLPYGRRMSLALVAMLVASGLTLVTPYLFKVTIDQYISRGDVAGLMRICLLTGAAFIGLYLATAAQQYLLSWVGQRVLANLRADMFHHLQLLPLGYHDTRIVGVTVSRVINDVAVINELLSEGWITLVGNLLILVGIVVVMLSMNLQLALLSFTVIPLMLLAMVLFSRRAKSAFRQTRTSVAAVVGDLAEGIAGMRVIQAFAQEEKAQERFDQVNIANRNAHVNALSLSFIFLPSIEFLGMLATCIVLWFGGQYVMQGRVTLGVLVAFLAYVTRFFQPIQDLSQLYNTLQSAMAGGERRDQRPWRVRAKVRQRHGRGRATAAAATIGQRRRGAISRQRRREGPHALGEFDQRFDDAVGVDVLHRLALVVAVGQDQHRAARGARRLRVVERVAHHQQALGRNAKPCRDVQQRVGRRLLRRQIVAADHDPEIMRDPGHVEVRTHEAGRLVGDDRHRHAGRGEPVEALAHPRIEPGLAAELRRVMRLVALEGRAQLLLVDGDRRDAERGGQRPAHEVRHALADQVADLGRGQQRVAGLPK